MVNKIRKRDGRIENFDVSKIYNAVMKAASEVAKENGTLTDIEATKRTVTRVESHLNEKYDEINIPTVEDIQDAVVKTLIELNHAKTSEKYILYRADRTKVRESKSRLMKSISEITFADSKESDLKRDNANVDGNTAMGTMLQYGSTISREFCKNEMMNPEHAHLHDNGDIHIHDMDFLNMGTLTCCQIDLNKLFKGGFSTGHGFLREPQDIMSYAALAAIAIQSNQNDQHGGQSIPAFDYYMAPGVVKSFKRSYFDNIRKAYKLLMPEPYKHIFDHVEFIEIEDGLIPTINMSENCEFIKKLEENLRDRYQVTDSNIMEQIKAFAYEEALKETDRKTYQAMEGFIHNLNTMHSRAGAQVPFSSINFGTDISPEGRMVSKNLLLAQEAGLGNGETAIFPITIFKVKEGVNYNPEDPNYDLFKLSCKVSSKRLFPNFSFLDAPFNKQYYIPGNVNSEASYMGCRTRVFGNINGESTVNGRGNLSFTSINLPRIAIKHGVVALGKFDEEGFFKELDEKIDAVIDQLLERMVVQGHKKVKNFPFLMGQGIWRDSDKLEWNDTLEEVIKHGTLTVGFIGLAECLKALIGVHHGESEEAQELGLKIIGHMRKRMDDEMEKTHLNFSLIATPAEGLSGRFTRMDKKIYGVIEGVTDREYYTNSFHVPVYYHTSAFEKIRKEAPYHELTNGGHISYIEMDGDPSNNLEAFETVIRYMKESGIGYGSVNHPVDRDPICGYSGVIEGHVCPKCGRDETKSEIKFDKIRRITGYLVGTVDRFNDGKRAEERDRVKHGI